MFEITTMTLRRDSKAISGGGETDKGNFLKCETKLSHN